MAKILVIDDEEFIRENIAEILTLEGYEIYTASNGKEGIAEAIVQQPDLILCDVMMPEMDGYEFLRNIRQTDTLVQIPVIYISAKQEKSDIRTAMNLGADDYITKPFDVSDLLDTVKVRLNKSEIRKEELNSKIREIQKWANYTSIHELNTPLNGIMPACEMIIQNHGEMSKEKIVQMIKIVHDSSKRLKRLVDNFLMYQKLSNYPHGGEWKKDLVIIDVHVVKKLMSVVLEKFNKNIDVQYNIQNGVVWFFPKLFGKITEELFDNAVKFSEPNGKIIINGTKDNDKYLFSVIDFGTGINEDNLKKIDAFVQFKRSYYEQQGSGLGLYIVSKLVEISGNQIQLDSNQGIGLKVTIIFQSPKIE